MKDLEKLMILGGISSIIIGLPMLNIKAIILFGLSYLFFIYGPFIFLINKIKTGVVEKFFLLNLSGLSYGVIYVIFDVFFKIPLTKSLFIIITLLIYTISYYIANFTK